MEDFIKNTIKFYLDFSPGDSILFQKNVVHIYDYRDSSVDRKSYNFRVAIKDNNKLNISSCNCGYVHELNSLHYL